MIAGKGLSSLSTRVKAVDRNATRKLSYRKDDRAKRRMYGRPENFRESLTMPTATFLEIFTLMGFVPIEPINVHAKFEFRSFTHSSDNRGYPKKLGSPWICPRSVFSIIFNGLVQMGPLNVLAKCDIRSFSHS